MTLLRKLAVKVSESMVRRCPPAYKDWASGISRELEFIESDWDALRWVLGSFRMAASWQNATLISLGWRTPAAFVFAIISMKFIFRTVLPLLENHRIPQLTDAGLFGVHSPHIRAISWNISMVVAQCLVFALPFAIVRFGLRNRVTQLACALLLIAVTVYTLRPWVMDLSGALTVLAAAAALLFPLWRRPMVVLAATSATAIAAVVACVYIRELVFVLVFHQHFFTLSASTIWICDAIGLALAAIVCVNLHRLLLRQLPTIY